MSFRARINCLSGVQTRSELGDHYNNGWYNNLFRSRCQQSIPHGPLATTVIDNELSIRSPDSGRPLSDIRNQDCRSGSFLDSNHGSVMDPQRGGAAKADNNRSYSTPLTDAVSGTVIDPTDGRKCSMEEEANLVIGIDLGTSCSCVAVFRGMDNVEIVPNERGSRVTPSYVAFTEQGECLVGKAAKNHAMGCPLQCIYEVKRLMGRSFGDPSVQRDAKTWPFEVSAGAEGEVLLGVLEGPQRERSFRPEEISAMLLTKLKKMAEDFTNCPSITDCVITVPAYFNNSQRKATFDAAAMAGLNVLRLMSEPTAAALAYGHQRLMGRHHVGKKILVFDLGGGTFDVSVITVNASTWSDESSFVVNAVAGDSHLGGADIDNRLLRHVADCLKSQNGGNDITLANPRVLIKLKQAVVAAKHSLSGQNETTIYVGCGESELSLTLSRADFETLNKALFDRCIPIVEQALRSAGFTKTEISDVILVGGSTRIPMVREMLTSFFGKPPMATVHPDEAVALGAAVQAGLLARSRRCASPPSPRSRIVVCDVTPLSIGVESRLGVMHVLIPRNTPIPVRKTVPCALHDKQEAMAFRLYEGERAMARHNRFLGNFALEGFSPAGATMSAARVMVTVDADGTLHATAEAMANNTEIGRREGVVVETLRAKMDPSTSVAAAMAAVGKSSSSSSPSEEEEEEDSDCCRHAQQEAEEEDARIWAAEKSYETLRDLVLRLLKLRINDCTKELIDRLFEVRTWLMPQTELAPKHEYDDAIERLTSLGPQGSVLPLRLSTEGTEYCSEWWYTDSEDESDLDEV